MKKVVFGAAMAAALMATPALAQDKSPFSLDVTAGVVSEYFFRGISQSDDNPAVQAGAELGYAINDTYALYAGVWGSTVDFNNGTDAEVDLTAGIRATYDKLGLDLGIIQYLYADKPAGEDLNYTEFKLVGSYDLGFVIPTAGVYYSPEFQYDSGDAYYITAGVTVPLPVTQFEPQLVANIGKQYIDDNDKFGLKDYVDWNVGLFASYWGFTAGVQYVDNNISSSQCDDGCRPAAVFSLSYGYSF